MSHQSESDRRREVEQRYYLLLEKAAIVLRNYDDLLSHPSLDIGDAEREEHERDAQALFELLPAKVRAPECAAPDTVRTTQCPF